MNVTSTVDVDVDPITAFTAFTDEIEQWWGNGPIDAWDSSRCIGRRLEPGVGGRLLEVYADERARAGPGDGVGARHARVLAELGRRRRDRGVTSSRSRTGHGYASRASCPTARSARPDSRSCA